MKRQTNCWIARLVLVSWICAAAGCHKDQPAAPAVSADAIRARLPAYYDFISNLKSQGYRFMDFRAYWSMNKDQLPEKMVVIRHDVHYRDVHSAYSMHAIEQALLDGEVATYFVMLDFPGESARQQSTYLALIEQLKADGVDVQPHISPNDMYVKTFQPSWRQLKLPALNALVAGDYEIVQQADSEEVRVVRDDVLDVRHLNQRLLTLLKRYNEHWTAVTGLSVQSYAAHGSSIPVNYVLNNSTLLNQKALFDAGVYQFDVGNTRVANHLTYLSDNRVPEWIEHPEQISPGRYQLLAHPKVWENPAETRKTYQHSHPDAGSVASAIPTVVE